MKALPFVAVVIASFGLVACSSSDDDGSAAMSSAVERPGAPTAEDATTIDACGLLTSADIQKYIDVDVAGNPNTSVPEAPGCVWENPDTYTSVTVDIGAPDTAINGTLPDPEPGFEGRPAPDGMRYFATGVVDFAADKRANSVQVANPNLSADESDAAALELARKVQERLQQ
ncbi:hypothetical protein [Antrihabitans sp. YC2-6]|uniref:hypothetical protein n=1 Tax=Antrihabitans sp. YC2-6 TaxID=2799498 RepID=UPI0018F7AC88|nr:hypothetical protein [Antrihabitans sp. YC2-6]MBJ8347885.1 hypothetical protein [Antrihabitans sp. YC2-6]